MNGKPDAPWLVRKFFAGLKTVGSLWFGALALALLLVAMACGTIFETRHGTTQALSEFYLSGWFAWLLALMAVSILAAVMLRFPFTRKQIGFVVTHVSIPLILAGALITHYWGVNGQIGLGEGQTATQFSVDQDALTIRRTADSAATTVELSQKAFAGLAPAAFRDGPSAALGNIQVAVQQYLPHSAWQRGVSDDNPVVHPAIEVSVDRGDGAESREWVFAGQSAEVGGERIAYRRVEDAAGWQKLIADQADERPGGGGVVRVTYGESTCELPLEDCLAGAVAVGNTGLTAQVLRYLPHAVVGPDNKVISGSDQPVNPAIEIEMSGPPGRERRFCFAKFPDFQHARSAIEGLDVLFVAPQSQADAFIEVLADPSDELYVRWNPPGGNPVTQKIQEGQPLEAPGDVGVICVQRRYMHARIDWRLVAADPSAAARTPAVEVAITADGQQRTFWVQKYKPRTETLTGVGYELTYAEKTLPLGFEVRLDKFRIGTYPGTGRPRSFESHVTFNNPAAGGAQSRVISMNHPAQFGSYTLYQSSYRQESGRSVSFLSVARDPGQPVVFAGYIALLAGMLLVLRARILDHRRTASCAAAGAAARRPKRTAVREEELAAV